MLSAMYGGCKLSEMDTNQEFIIGCPLPPPELILISKTW